MRDNLHVAMSAREYHDYTSGSMGPWDELLIGRLNSEYKPPPPARTIVDVGTGTAVLPIKLAAIPKFDGAFFVGTDLFLDMVETAREAVHAVGLSDRIRVDQCDVHAMPYEDDWADYVISRSTVHHWADPVQAFREIFRILRPGGIALIHAPRRDPNPTFLEDVNRRRRAAGFEPNDLSEKYTAAEAGEFLAAAQIRAYSKITAPEQGPASMGFEVRIEKPSRTIAQGSGQA